MTKKWPRNIKIEELKKSLLMMDNQVTKEPRYRTTDSLQIYFIQKGEVGVKIVLEYITST